MYAVIRAGGKQYRVAPGDVIRVEKLEAQDNRVEFSAADVLAVSANEGEVGRPQGEARVTAEVLGEVRGDKILVFHYKRKKQYKKLAGHRQPYTAVRITEIAFDGQSFKAPEKAPATAKGPKAPEGGAAPEEAVKPKRKSGKGSAVPSSSAGKTRAQSTGASTKGGTSRKPKK
jgi:large subunit ribosomal protein L21